MRNISSPGEKCLWLSLTLVMAAGFAASAWAAEAGEYSVAGTFIEGCSCAISCPCETKGLKHGCNGIQAYSFTSGSYEGVDLAGARFVAVSEPGIWNRLYLQPRKASQQKALSDLATAVYTKMGKVESVQNARISITGKEGRYTLRVNDGKIATLTTEPVKGATPGSFEGTKNPFSPTFYQAKTVKGSFRDGGHSFKLEGTNSFFNDKAENKGSL